MRDLTALTRLHLVNFRSHDNLQLGLDARPVCLYGHNGAGKTNILEAISQLGPGRGLRGAALQDMTRHQANGWTVAATLGEDQKLGVALSPSGAGYKRSVRLSGAPASMQDLAELMRIIWLTPAMDGVFRGGASDRRRFFDRQVMAHLPDHGAAAARYEKAMRERNALLERGWVDPGWAEAIEGRMAEAGAILASNRVRILARLQSAIDARYDGLFPKADLGLEGVLETEAAAGKDVNGLATLFADLLRQGRSRDQAAGRCLTGPHRSDLQVMHRPTRMPAREASTGQQKALLIGLVLASARALCLDERGPPPLILLDEAAAHLDQARRAALFEELLEIGGQAWLTGTEASLFDAFEDRAQKLEISLPLSAD